MNLQLNRPLAIFDLETTGVQLAKDRIVEIFVLKVMPDGTKEEYYSLVNPKMPIPDVVTQIHGITDEKVANEPSFLKLAFDLNDFLEGCDLAGFNSNAFDIPILKEEFHRCGIDFDLSSRKTVDVFRIFTKMEPRNLAAAYNFYCDKTIENAHSAKADVMATYEVLEAQVGLYSGKLPDSVDGLHDFTNEQKYLDSGRRFVEDAKGVVCFNFGKNKGIPVEEVLRSQPNYYDWMMRSDFLLDTKQVLKGIKEKMNS